ncbi:MAG TPA: dienelactone hydrolase family protein, partial [Myxococcales bacterium]|nr:dienelactone hydrolase family protein [Myxococcales bacterium]
QEWIDVASAGRTLKVFVVHPEAKGKMPAVLIIHENMGLTDWVRDLADQLAAAGYLAVAPEPTGPIWRRPSSSTVRRPTT